MKKTLFLILSILIFWGSINTAYADDFSQNEIFFEFYDDAGILIDDFSVLSDGLSDYSYYFPDKAAEIKISVLAEDDSDILEIFIGGTEYGTNPYFDISGSDLVEVYVSLTDDASENKTEYTFALNRNDEPRDPSVRAIQWRIGRGNIKLYPEDIIVSQAITNIEIPMSADRFFIDYFESGYLYTDIKVIAENGAVSFGNIGSLEFDMMDGERTLILLAEIDGIKKEYELHFSTAEQLSGNNGISAFYFEYYDMEGAFIDSLVLEDIDETTDIITKVPKNTAQIYLCGYPQEITASLSYEYQNEIYEENLFEYVNGMSVQVTSAAEDGSEKQYVLVFNKDEENIEENVAEEIETKADEEKEKEADIKPEEPAKKEPWKYLYIVIPIIAVILAAVVVFAIRKQKNRKG